MLRRELLRRVLCWPEAGTAVVRLKRPSGSPLYSSSIVSPRVFEVPTGHLALAAPAIGEPATVPEITTFGNSTHHANLAPEVREP